MTLGSGSSNPAQITCEPLTIGIELPPLPSYDCHRGMEYGLRNNEAGTEDRSDANRSINSSVIKTNK